MSWKHIRNLLFSSSFRFALLTSCVIWFSTVAVLVVMFFQLERDIWQGIESNLENRTRQLLENAHNDPQQSTENLINEFNGETDSIIAIPHGGSHRGMMSGRNGERRDIHRSFGLSSPPGYLLNQNQSVSLESGKLRVSRAITLPNGDTVVLKENVEYLHTLESSLWKTLWVGLAVTLVLALISSILLTQRSLGRIHQINQDCQTIMQGNLSHRISYKNNVMPAGRKPFADDYDQMAFHINSMLDEINHLMGRIRQVSDNVAHDLKSPLARLRVKLEQAYEKGPSPEVDESIQEVDRLLAMIKSLLGIARLESGTHQGFEKIHLPMLLNDLEEMYQPVFEDKQITFAVSSEDIYLTGDKHLLIQALANILDNASKYTPTNGSVEVRATVSGDHDCQLVIQDSGPGIPEDQFERVFERFARLDEARSSSGFGLGLSLVKAIIGLHKGQIKLANDHGLQVQITMPRL
ncbi:sensor histidine kinase [Gynuella sunshinyii]|uniref:histidine kinase n=1 Tax=Gynuella sunshinyii YC6258 TaxID=1445510 RepID=A0A0C5VNN0_9GAMM|nr:HAMP domain-containing sensor histidine kinase [Gynuella sunshinyii]AJQ95921.1 signal transduction histidine kinase [Gynuella sunshinyii YC6258]